MSDKIKKAARRRMAETGEPYALARRKVIEEREAARQQQEETMRGTVPVTGPEPPENVRIVIGDREYPCDVLRDPDQDRDGCAAWVTVPREPLPDDYRLHQVEIRAAVLPARTLLCFSLSDAP